MSRYRLAIVAAVLVVFVAVGAYLVFGHSSSVGQDVSINLSVTGANSMQPAEPSVRQNDNVTINVSSDTDGEVHLHGYDIAFDTKAGEVVSHTFRAVNSGRFPIEWESTGAPLGDLNVSP